MKAPAFVSTISLWALPLFLIACAPGSSGGDASGGGAAGASGASGTTGAAGTTGTSGTLGTAGTVGTGGAAGTTAGRGGASTGTSGSSGAAGSTGAGGMCSGAPGAPFAPITDYTARDGGFGPAVVARNTGDTALGADKVAIFRPAAAKYGQGGVTHPIIVWGNGHTNTSTSGKAFLRAWRRTDSWSSRPNRPR